MPNDPQQLPNFRKSRAPRLRECVRIASAALACALLPLAGCKDGPTTTARSAAGGTRVDSSGAGGEGLALVDPSDDVVASPFAGGAGSRADAPTGGSRSVSGAAPASPNVAATAKGRWSVMLATFTQPDHLDRANAFRVELVRQYPELSGAMVRRLGKGSAIVVGRFEGPEDKAAQAELKRVKAIERDGRRPFAGALLLRTAADDASGPVKPHDLRSLRARFPKVRPLFTLQVAAWSTFGEKGADYGEMRKAAERYCAELRKKGHDAYFHHDEDSETSIVTIGSFDRRAYDPRTTLYAPEVADLMREFPAHLVNGEPLLIPTDPANPKGRTKPQPCQLVEVPET